jgi:hypothetical protein
MKSIEELNLKELIDCCNRIIRLDNSPCPYEAEILSRFAELEKENESLRCCGNCGLSRYDNDYGLSCSYNFKKVKPNDRYCDNWQSDNLTQKERET